MLAPLRLAGGRGVRTAVIARSATARAARASVLELRPGQQIEGFVVERVREVAKEGLTAAELRHSATGAAYLHLHRDDNNNTFAVALRTPPASPRQLPHVLKRMVRCGSRRFPCRDLFSQLSRRCRACMDATAGPGYTLYSFATQNPSDYYKLMSVYLDTVFEPMLREEDFRQEGVRLEHENINDPRSPVVFKGVVFNEVKSEDSDPQFAFKRTLFDRLMPNCAQRFVKDIVDLTYKDVKDYHARFYHPRNVLFYSNGNLKLADHLGYVNTTLDLMGPRVVGGRPWDAGTAVPAEPRWTARRVETATYWQAPLAPDPSKQSTAAVAALLADIRDLDAQLLWRILRDLLLAGPSAPFYRSLVEPQLGAAFAPVTGFDTTVRDTSFTVGLQGVAQGEADRVVEAIQRTVDSVVEKGFDAQRVSAALHAVKQGQRQVAGPSLLLLELAPLWASGGNVLRSLRSSRRLRRLRRRLRDNPRYLQEALDRGLRQNPHYLVLTAAPDPELPRKLGEREARVIVQQLARLGGEGRAGLYRRGLELAAAQAREQDSSCLPWPGPATEPPEPPPASQPHSRTLQGVPVQINAFSIDGLVLWLGILSGAHLSEQHRALLPLLGRLVARMGTRSSGYRELDQRIRAKGVMLKFFHFLVCDVADVGLAEEGLQFVSGVREGKVEDMFAVLTEILTELTLEDERRFSALVRGAAAELGSEIASAGNDYAVKSAAAQLGGVCWRHEQASGLTHVAEMRRIAQLADCSQTLAGLREAAAALLNKSRMRCSVFCRRRARAGVLAAADGFLGALPGREADRPLSSPPPAPPAPQYAVHHVLPLPLSCAAKAVRTVPCLHAHYAPLRVLEKLLNNKYFPAAVARGSACGAAADASTDGTFNFHSCRDPNPGATFEAFDGAACWVREGRFLQQDVEAARVGALRETEDALQLLEALLRFTLGLSDAQMQEHRRQLQAVTREQLQEVAARYLEAGPGAGPAVGRALVGPDCPLLRRTRAADCWTVRLYD